jgi:hypothetical protein
MRHVRTIAILSVFALIFLSAGSAFADGNTVSMDFLNVGPGNNGGGVYTYPYNFSVNGGPSTPLICDSFDNEVTPGETWQATATSLLSDLGLFKGQSNSLLDYEAAGLIYLGILNGTINPTAGNWAIWGLFSSNAYNNSFFTSSGANGIYNQYLALAGSQSASQLASELAGVEVYTPIAGTQPNGDGLPQEYFGLIQTPEAGSMAMLAFGFLLIGGAIGKRFVAQAQTRF